MSYSLIVFRMAIRIGPDCLKYVELVVLLWNDLYGQVEACIVDLLLCEPSCSGVDVVGLECHCMQYEGFCIHGTQVYLVFCVALHGFEFCGNAL